ncbi:MAG: response regulator [Campylobacterota bacterium]|nr:response regulator [Campylobacterota bacterium]
MGKLKILIVEDETIVALDIKSAVKQFGYEVTGTATNHDDALKSVRKNTPDLILMDINLENSLDGIQTVHAIHRTQDIPVIYLTAYSDDETVQRAVETNPLHYLIKPFKRDELKSTLLLAMHKIKKPDFVDKRESYEELGHGYYFDMANENLYYNDLPLKLGLKEIALLKILIDAKGSYVSYENLQRYIWANDTVSASSVRTLIYRLRSKLEHKLIESKISVGCKLILDN